VLLVIFMVNFGKSANVSSFRFIQLACFCCGLHSRAAIDHEIDISTRNFNCNNGKFNVLYAP